MQVFLCAIISAWLQQAAASLQGKPGALPSLVRHCRIYSGVSRGQVMICL